MQELVDPNASLCHIKREQRISSVSCFLSELQRAELLVDGQDVMVELSGEQQVLQSSHILLDGSMVLRDKTYIQIQIPVRYFKYLFYSKGWNYWIRKNSNLK